MNATCAEVLAKLGITCLNTHQECYVLAAISLFPAFPILFGMCLILLRRERLRDMEEPA